MNTPSGVMRRPAEILHVDDQADYAELTREAFKMSSAAVNLHYAKDGEQCMAFIRREGMYADAPTPDIILLDLNMPRMDGREVLLAISKDESLRHLPVVILTTSAEEEEILKMYQLRCSFYIVKPLDFNELIRVIKSFTDLWLTVAILPSTRSAEEITL
ncbi:MAG TPA: response regulator [Verrucomicrobiae bacterium]|nr:response regulator [Verrucomicrobiae bacterium]